MTKFAFRHQIDCGQSLPALLMATMLFCTTNVSIAQRQDMLVRISEIEVYPHYLEEYKAILKYEAEASVRLEEGVIAIFPMFQKEDPTQVRILEMYKDEQAYQAHLKTKHFLEYKTTTLHMVKSLRLVDMDVLDPETMTAIFNKSGNTTMENKQKKY